MHPHCSQRVVDLAEVRMGTADVQKVRSEPFLNTDKKEVRHPEKPHCAPHHKPYIIYTDRALAGLVKNLFFEVMRIVFF